MSQIIKLGGVRNPHWFWRFIEISLLSSLNVYSKSALLNTSISHIMLTLTHALRQNPYTHPIQNNLLIRHSEVYGRFQILLLFSSYLLLNKINMFRISFSLCWVSISLSYIFIVTVTSIITRNGWTCAERC